MDLSFLSIAKLSELLSNKSISSVELVQSLLGTITKRQLKLNSFITVDEEFALEQAKHADQQLALGNQSRLMGIPIAIKDNILVKGLKATGGSRILENFVAPYDATVIEQLKKLGMIIIGKTNLDEFGMGSSNENSAFGAAKNPWDINRTPGGSSGGSAAAISSGMVPVALGSDTGGSIRQPASFCGILGLKPTYGRVSRYGLMAYGSSLDQIGPMGRSVEDVAMILHAISGKDSKDATSVQQPIPPFFEQMNQPIAGKKIGVIREFVGQGCHPQVQQKILETIEVYRSAGAEIVDISLPLIEYSIAIYYLIATAEASSNLSRYDGIRYTRRASGGETLLDLYKNSRQQGFGSEVKRRIMLGTYALCSGYYDAYYGKALKVRDLLRASLQQVFKDVDLLLCPTAPTTAFKLGEKLADPLAMYLGDIYTIFVNLTGVPAISVPCGFDETGLPIGFQLIANHWQEGILLQGANAYEQRTEWTQRKPDLS